MRIRRIIVFWNSAHATMDELGFISGGTEKRFISSPKKSGTTTLSCSATMCEFDGHLFCGTVFTRPVDVLGIIGGTKRILISPPRKSVILVGILSLMLCKCLHLGLTTQRIDEGSFREGRWQRHTGGVIHPPLTRTSQLVHLISPDDRTLSIQCTARTEPQPRYAPSTSRVIS